MSGIDPGRVGARARGDRRLGYDRLLLATGAEPRRLDVPGSDLDGVHYLRTLADSERIGERIERGQRLVVVGSGWIGAEIAASARQKGCEVTMIEMSSLPLERVLGPEVGRSTSTSTATTGSSSCPRPRLSASKASARSSAC